MPKIWILSFDEPVFYGRLYADLLETHGDKIDGVVVLPSFAGKGIKPFLKEVRYRLLFLGLAGFAYLSARYIQARLTRSGNFSLVAAERGIQVVRFETLGDAIDLLRDKKPDFILATVLEKVPKELLDQSRYGWVNIHCGPLPRYAGSDAPFWCILKGEPNMAVTIHIMEEHFDSGPILSQSFIANTGEPYFVQLRKLFRQATADMRSFLDQPMKTYERRKNQDARERTYVKKPTIEDGRLYRSKGFRFC